MKRFIRRLLTLAVLLAVAFVGIGFLLPSQFSVERSIVIDAKPARVHEFVGDLRRWPEWSPWQESDPTIKVEIGERSSGLGARQRWSGESGSGELIFTSDSPDEGVKYEMSFDQGAYRATSALNYKDEGDSTKVSWTMAGDSGSDLVARYRGIVIDFFVGRQFQRGLEKLKAKVEAATG